MPAWHDLVWTVKLGDVAGMSAEDAASLLAAVVKETEAEVEFELNVRTGERYKVNLTHDQLMARLWEVEKAAKKRLAALNSATSGLPRRHTLGGARRRSVRRSVRKARRSVRKSRRSVVKARR